MGTGNINKTDLYHINNITQNTMLSHAKEVFIETLRDIFSQDSEYHYVRDAWGFPEVINLTGIPTEAGLHDDVTTRLFIGESFKMDMIYYPAILVRGGSFRSVPISMSRNEELIHYKVTRVIDGYGNEKLFSTPDYFNLSGAWEGQIIIDVVAGDVQARDELVDLVAAIIQIARYKEFQKAGVFLKPLSISSASEVDDRSGKLYKMSITCDVRTEWNQQIPITSVVDAIMYCVDFGDLSQANPIFAPNIEAKGSIDLIQIIEEM